MGFPAAMRPVPCKIRPAKAPCVFPALSARLNRTPAPWIGVTRKATSRAVGDNMAIGPCESTQRLLGLGGALNEFPLPSPLHE
jgi:hypothetical protein